MEQQLISAASEEQRGIRLVRGLDKLGAEAAALDDLQRRAGCPVTARLPWQETWLRTRPHEEPLLVLVERDGSLDAAALLAVRRRRRCVEVVSAGHGVSDDVRLPAIDEAAAELLAYGTAEALTGLNAPWRLELRRVPPEDPVIRHLREWLPRAVLVESEASPQLELGADRAVRGYVSRNHHQQVRRMQNRLRKDGHRVEVDAVTSPEAVSALLPEMERLFHARDEMVRRRCLLDDPADLGFFREVLVLHALRGELVVTTLRIGSALAAYVVCFRDGPAWRMWNCRFDPAWSTYGVGRIAVHASLEAALDAGCSLYDWMEGEEDYKRQMSNRLQAAVSLRATSSWPQWLATEPWQRSLARARRARDGHAGLRRTSEVAKEVLWSLR